MPENQHVQGLPIQPLITGEGIELGAGQQVIKQDKLYLISNTSYDKLKMIPMGRVKHGGNGLDRPAMGHQTAS
uniref:Uncharacterized protein n=1 Tax=Rhinopithecus roxellana TaxID=61622 RepID=A0A2K6PIR2_RHIRO